MSGMMKLSGSGTVANVPSFQVDSGATLSIDNSGTNNAARDRRLGGDQPERRHAGFHRPRRRHQRGHRGRDADAGHGVHDQLHHQRRLASLGLLSLTQNPGATLSLIGSGADLGTATNRVFFDSTRGGFVAPSFTGGILPYATVSGSSGLDLVGDVDAGASVSLGAATYDASNVKITSNTTLSGTINALLLSGGSVDTGTATLTVASGQIVNAGGANTISSGVGGGLTLNGTGHSVFVAGGSTLDRFQPAHRRRHAPQGAAGHAGAGRQQRHDADRRHGRRPRHAAGHQRGCFGNQRRRGRDDDRRRGDPGSGGNNQSGGTDDVRFAAGEPGTGFHAADDGRHALGRPRRPR